MGDRLPKPNSSQGTLKGDVTALQTQNKAQSQKNQALKRPSHRFPGKHVEKHFELQLQTGILFF